MLDWQDIQFFVVVARFGSLTAAARELHVNHATVGRRIASLEASIGLKLVERLPGKSSLTEAGRTLATIAAPMDDASNAIVRHARTATALSGTVTLSTLPALASVVIAPSLVRLTNRYPSIDVIVNANANEVSLERGDADIAVGLIRPKATGRIVRRVGSISYRIYASHAHAAKPPSQWTFVGFEKPLEHVAQHRWLLRFAQVRRITFRSSDVMTQHAAATAGLGVAVLPQFLARGNPSLIDVAPDIQPLTRPLWMSVHADVRRSPAVRAVMDHLVALLAEGE